MPKLKPKLYVVRKYIKALTAKGKADFLLFVRFMALVLTQVLGEPPPLPKSD